MSINAKFGNLANGSTSEGAQKFRVEHRSAQGSKDTAKVHDRSQNKGEDTKGGGFNPKRDRSKRKNWSNKYRQSRNGGGHYAKPFATRESLDNELDDYFMKNPKVAEEKLNEELDSYMAQRSETTTIQSS